MAQQRPRLVRVREGRMISGVAAGLARYLNIDVIIVRLAFVALTIANPIGLLVYFVLWIAMPEAEKVGGEAASGPLHPESAQRVRALFGMGLMALGALFIARQFGLRFFMHDLSRFLGPLVLVGIGIALLTRRSKGE